MQVDITIKHPAFRYMIKILTPQRQEDELKGINQNQ